MRVYWTRPGRRYNPAAREAARTRSLYMPSDNPVLIYRHRPNYEKDGVKLTEDHGILRPDAVSREKPPSTYRIALIGDSIAAGLFFDYDKRFGTLLEKRLNEFLRDAGKKAEVLNFGVNGYKTLQEAVLCESVVGDLSPDSLIVQYCMNDPGNSVTPTIWFRDPPVSYLAEFLSERLFLYARHAPMLGPTYETTDYWYSLYDPKSASWKSVEEGFRRISALARTKHIPVLLVIFPFLVGDETQRARGRQFSEQVKAVALSHSWTTVDMSEVFDKYPVASLQCLDEDIYHPNEKGHELAAESVFLAMTGVKTSRR